MPRALVTGANRGLGLETCRQLVERGFEVLLASRDEAAGRAAASELGHGVRALRVDVSDLDGVVAAASTLEGEPPLDALVNNAGATFGGFDSDVVERTLDVNYRGAVRVTDAFLPRLAPEANVVMVSSGMGSLDAVSPELRRRLLAPELDRDELDALVDEFVAAVRSDDATLAGWPRNAYRVSKAALNAFTRIVSREPAFARRRVNAVCPGWVRTRMGGASASRDVQRGAAGIVWAAMLGAGEPSGGFFRDGRSIDW
jgi:NAD(P)-dependent dehydrogenase (short-subunit alcohol dehydrogenase family)